MEIWTGLLCSEYGLFKGRCVNDNEHLGSIKSNEFLELMSEYQLIKEGFQSDGETRHETQISNLKLRPCSARNRDAVKPCEWLRETKKNQCW